MENNLYSIDFFKTFRLEKPISGLVKQITSPKGVRIAGKNEYIYKLHTELCCIYRGEPCELAPGVYYVLDICRPYDHVIWNHYIFVVDSDGFTYPIAEYLEQTNTLWVKSVIPIIKGALNNDLVESIDLTHYKHEKQEKVAWKSYKK